MGLKLSVAKVRKTYVESLASEDSSLCLSTLSNSTYAESVDVEYAPQQIKISIENDKDIPKKKLPQAFEKNDPTLSVKSESTFSSAYRKFSLILSNPTNNQDVPKIR